ncbi:MAG: tetratricopeptide repeat protein [Trueperaceae bacterium]|nr:MAG: tetratricopeptide repeat protein [Trueperaceae bacterium]
MIVNHEMNLGQVLTQLGDYLAATECFEEALTLYRELADKSGVEWNLFHLAHLSFRVGDYLRAMELYQENLAIMNELGNRWASAHTLNKLGNLYLAKGDLEAAHRVYAECLAVRRVVAKDPEVAGALTKLGTVARHRGQLAVSWVFFEEAQIKVRGGATKADVFEGLGSLVLEEGDIEQARVHFETSLALTNEAGDRRRAASALYGLGRTALELRELDLAKEQLRESLPLRVELEERHAIAESLEAYAQLAASSGELVESGVFWRAATDLRQAIGAARLLADGERYRRLTASSEPGNESKVTLEEAVALALGENR